MPSSARRVSRPSGARTSRPSHPAGSPAGVARGETGSSQSPSGLFGSTVGDKLVRTSVAELVGTFLLVLVGTSVATTAVQSGELYSAAAVAIAFGLILTALVAGLGHVSGCHLNPAVTIGLAVTRQFPWKSVPAYLGAQLIGAVLASLAVWAAHGSDARSAPVHLGAATPAAGVGAWQAALVEVLITFLLVLVVCAVATDDRVPKAAAPLAVGAALAAAVFVGLPVTGGAVNPARAFGPFLVAGEFPMPLVYLLAPLLGGVLGAVAYDRLLRPASPPSTADAARPL